MRISEYKQALKPIPNSNLDSFVAIRSDTSIHFEPATSPPERWNRFQGTIVHAPGRTTPENGEPVSPSEIGGLEANTLRSEQFLAGFMQDLTEEFGADIAMQCFSHPGLSGETPITARTVREVIGYAEEAFDANTPAHTASRLKSYFQHGMWTGVISMASNPDEPRLLGNATSLITEPLPKSAEEFVIALISKRCLALPRQTLATLSLDQFVEIAKEALNLYHEIRTLPMMSREALQMTFTYAVMDLEIKGLDVAEARLPLHAATACFLLNLNPDNQSVWSTFKGRLPGVPTMVHARIQEQFRSCFVQILSRRMPADASTCREVFDHLITQVEQSLDSILSEYLQLQNAIEAPSVFSPRQKLTLNQWLDQGNLAPEQMEALFQLADWAHQELCQKLPSLLTGHHAANAIATMLSHLADGVEQTAIIAVKNQRAKAPDAMLTGDDYRILLGKVCSTHTTLAATALSIQEAKALSDALNGNAGTTALQILQDKGLLSDLVEHLHDTLKASLLQRSTEVEEDFHAVLAEGLSHRIEASRRKGVLLALPNGELIPQIFWKGIDTLSLTLERADGNPYIETDDWNDIDLQQKMERMEDALNDIADDFFAGDTMAASSFFDDLPIIGPSILSMCAENFALCPILLSDGTAVAKLPANGTQHQTITLFDTEHRHHSFVSAHRITLLSEAVDAKGKTRWLIPNESHIEYQCHLMRTPEGKFVLLNPMRLTSQLTPSQWPIADYPEPTVQSLMSPHYAARDDLMAYASSTGNHNHVTVLKALDALHALEDDPWANSALAFFGDYISSGALACLGDIGGEVLPIANQLCLRFRNSLGLPLLNAIASSLLEDHFILKEPYPLRKDWIVQYKEMVSIFSDDMPEENRAALTHKYLRAEAGSYVRPQAEISEEELKEFRSAIFHSLEPLMPETTTPLKDRIVNFIAAQILPGFIAAAREEAASEQ